MKQSNTDHLEMIIKEAIKDELENTSEPSLSTEKAWEQLNSKLDENRSIQKKHRLSRNLMYTACVAIIMMSLIFFMPQGSEANKIFTEMFQIVQDSTVRIFGGVGGESHSTDDFVEPDINDFTVVEGSEAVAEFVDLEEAQEKTAFTIQVPTVIPEGFELDDVMIMTTQISKSDDVYLNYKSEEAHFNINQKLIEDEFGFGSVADADDVHVEEMEVNGYEAFLSQYDGYTILVWVTPNRYYSIHGILSKEEIIEMANSL